MIKDYRPHKVRFRIFARQKFTCQYCGKKAPDVKLHLDHIVPKSLGGDDSESNLTTSCASCNLAKHNAEISPADHHVQQIIDFRESKKPTKCYREQFKNPNKMRAAVRGYFGNTFCMRIAVLNFVINGASTNLSQIARDFNITKQATSAAARQVLAAYWPKRK